MKYKVLKHFQWGRLKLEKDQIILITESDNTNSLVSINHYPEKSQLINSKAIQGMISLKKIERY